MKDLTKLFAAVGITVVVICVVASTGAHAAGFAPLRLADTGETCYSWQGGNFSAGSFSKCQPAVEVVVLQPMAPPPAPMPMAAAPVCPPQITVMPEPRPKPRLFHKPRPKVICKPA